MPLKPSRSRSLLARGCRSSTQPPTYSLESRPAEFFFLSRVATVSYRGSVHFASIAKAWVSDSTIASVKDGLSPGFGESTARSKATDTSPDMPHTLRILSNVDQPSLARARSGTVDRNGDASAP